MRKKLQSFELGCQKLKPTYHHNYKICKIYLYKVHFTLSWDPPHGMPAHQFVSPWEATCPMTFNAASLSFTKFDFICLLSRWASSLKHLIGLILSFLRLVKIETERLFLKGKSKFTGFLFSFFFSESGRPLPSDDSTSEQIYVMSSVFIYMVL